MLRSRKYNQRSFLYQHFRKQGHSPDNITIQPVEHILFDVNATTSFNTKALLFAELKWIKNLQTPFSLGLNDNIYQSGNISRLPSIDIFSLFSIRRRKTRSHGVRKNGNIKRKSRRKVSILDLHNLLNNTGIHSMLSRLSSLSISSLREVDQEADKIISRFHPCYNTASLIQSYSQHVLRPHIDTESEHKRFFLKSNYINKGIDFIDLQSIFHDYKVMQSIPTYFQNSEPPIICYKYNKPVRSLIFNYNQTVRDLDINDTTPQS